MYTPVDIDLKKKISIYDDKVRFSTVVVEGIKYNPCYLSLYCDEKKRFIKICFTDKETNYKLKGLNSSYVFRNLLIKKINEMTKGKIKPKTYFVHETDNGNAIFFHVSQDIKDLDY